MKGKNEKKREGVAAKPRRQGDGEGVGRKEKKRKKKKEKERMRGAAPHPGSLAGCTRARNCVSRLVCGLVGGSRTEEVNGAGRETGRRLEGKIENGKMEEEWKPKGVMLCKEGRRKGVGRSSREQEACLLGNVHLAFLRLENRSCKKAFGD